MKFLRIMTLALCLALVGLVSATMAQSTEDDPLSGTEWELVSYGVSGEETPVAEGSSTTLNLEANEIGGNGGCNTYGGSYTVEGDTISFSDVFSTLMLCADEAVNQQEQDYFAALESATTFEITENQLTIYYNEGESQLNFAARATSDLVGTAWELVSYGGTDVLPETNLTLSFPAAGQVGGEGGCNGFGGSYTVEGETITFGELISTMMACMEDGVMEQEQAYLEALNNAQSYQMTDDTLTIIYNDGEELVFNRAASLAGSSWQLVAMGPMGEEAPIAEGSEITLNFSGVEQANGNGGCNQYSSQYTVDGDTLNFGAVVSTRMACADKALTQQEQAYFTALETAFRYEITEDQLTIWTQNTQLVYERVAADELVGTWELAAYGAAGEQTPVVEDSSVTLVLQADGQAGGNGSCNTYGGSYTVEGDTISFSEVISTLMACADEAVNQQEQAYFAALQEATRYEVANGELTVWYGEDMQLNFVQVADAVEMG